MSKQHEALKLALEALEDTLSGDLTPYQAAKTITAIREALAEQPAQQQEPMAQSKAYDMIDRFLRNNLNSDDDYAEYSTALDSLYTSPPASKPWVGLTQQDIDIAFDDTQEGGGFDEFARAIEAKLREKNA